MTQHVAAAMQEELTKNTRRHTELRNQRDALTFTLERAEADAASRHGELEPGNITEALSAACSLVNETADRLRRVESEKAEVEARIAELSKLLRAPAAMSAAENQVRQARAAISEAQASLDQALGVVEQIADATAAEAVTNAQARERAKVSAIRGLPAFARELLGVSGEAAKGEAQVADLVASEHRAAGLDEARARALQIVAQREKALADAQADEKAATAELLVQRAICAELDHAEALSTYLRTLGRYCALHRAAFDFDPELPNLKLIVAESRASAMRAAEAEASADLEPVPPKRGSKLLSALAAIAK